MTEGNYIVRVVWYHGEPWDDYNCGPDHDKAWRLSQALSTLQTVADIRITQEDQ